MVILVTGNLQAAMFDGLVAYWPLDDNVSNNVVLDISGNGNDGTATIDTDKLSKIGPINNCFDFDETSYVTVPDDDTLSFGNGTTDFAIKGVWGTEN